jgi:hypothetical protein
MVESKEGKRRRETSPTQQKPRETINEAKFLLTARAEKTSPAI